MYKSSKELLELKDNVLLPTLMHSTSCIVMRVETDEIGQMLKLIEMMNDLSFPKKHLQLFVSASDSSKFANLTINFQVSFHQKKKGDKVLIF